MSIFSLINKIWVRKCDRDESVILNLIRDLTVISINLEKCYCTFSLLLWILLFETKKGHFNSCARSCESIRYVSSSLEFQESIKYFLSIRVYCSIIFNLYFSSSSDKIDCLDWKLIQLFDWVFSFDIVIRYLWFCSWIVYNCNPD